MELYKIVNFFIVGIMWGTTNSLMEMGAKLQEKQKPSEEGGILGGLGNVFSNWRFLLPFGLNQLAYFLRFLQITLQTNAYQTCSDIQQHSIFHIEVFQILASLLNNFLIAGSDLSVAVPAVNCITFVVTFMSGRLLKGQSIVDGRFFFGLALVVAGMYLCFKK